MKGKYLCKALYSNKNITLHFIRSLWKYGYIYCISVNWSTKKFLTVPLTWDKAVSLHALFYEKTNCSKDKNKMNELPVKHIHSATWTKWFDKLEREMHINLCRLLRFRMKMHYPPETHSSCFMRLVYYSLISIYSNIHLLNKQPYLATHFHRCYYERSHTLLLYWAQKQSCGNESSCFLKPETSHIHI